MDAAAEIRALVVAYCERLDAGDFDGVAALFADGAFRSPAGTNLVGRDAVRSQYDAVIRYDDGTPRTKHVLGNLVIDADADGGIGRARCTFTVLQAIETPAGGAVQPVLSGRYHDHFARAGDTWHFTERLVLPDLYGDLSHHMRPRS